jgi:putative transposase
MAKAHYRPGTKVRIEGIEYRLEQKTSDNVWYLKRMDSGAFVTRSRFELDELHDDEKLSFVPSDIVGISGKTSAYRVARTKLSDDQVEESIERREYVKAIQGLPVYEKGLVPVIRETWERLRAEKAKKAECKTEPRQAKNRKKKPGGRKAKSEHDSNAEGELPFSEQPPHWTTVYRWAAAFEASDGNTNALASDHAGKGNRTPRFPDRVIEICENALDDYYLTRARPTLESTLSLAKAVVAEENKKRLESEPLPAPSRRLLKRLLDEIPAYDRCVARYGREIARKRFRAVLNIRLTDFVLQRVEADHTLMDVFVVDEQSGAPLGRPWLTIFIDDFSRVVLGYALSFEPPSCASVAKCMKHAFMPKTRLKQTYPDLVNEWVMHGVPMEIVFDGGLEFYAKEIRHACHTLDIAPHFAPRKTPWFKGKVERFLGTLNRGVTEMLPGKTFGSIFERGDYDSSKHAVLFLSDLRELIVRWIVDVYHQKTHRGLGCSPAQMWAAHAKDEDIPVIADPLMFDAVVGGHEERALTHKGIEFSNLFYNSNDLTDIRKRYGETLVVSIRVDRSNLGSIVVLHPDSEAPIRVPCLRKDYAEGLTEWQHSVCRKHTRDNNKPDNADSWLWSFHEICKLVREILGDRPRNKQQRAGRWQESEATSRHASDQPVEPPTPPAKAATPAPKAQAKPTPAQQMPHDDDDDVEGFTPIFDNRNR